MKTGMAVKPTYEPKRKWLFDIRINRWLYVMAVPIIIYFLVFSYAPMGGILIAFEDYKPAKGILDSAWVGFKHFSAFFTGPNFKTILRNTLVINLLSLVISFPLTIAYALLLNELRFKPFKKVTQTVHYLPYFVSMVVICGLILEFCSTNGVVTSFLVNVFGIKRQNLLQNPNYFWAINLVSDIWQGLGYGSIFFVAAISGVSQEIHEAAAIDGANRLRRAWHVTLPGIMPAIVTMLVLRCGMMLQVGGDKILLLYNPSIYSTADVISTHVQRMGLEQMNYGYSTAVGLFNSVVGTILLITSNVISRKLTDVSVI